MGGVSIFGGAGASLFGELNKAQQAERESVSSLEASLKARDVVTGTKEVQCSLVPRPSTQREKRKTVWKAWVQGYVHVGTVHVMECQNIILLVSIGYQCFP